MNSMTGFGRAESDTRFGRFSVEISSVNNRFRELAVRMPRSLSALEPKVRDQVTEVVTRGKLSVFINLIKPEEGGDLPTINKAAIRSYYQQLAELQQELGVGGEIQISDLLSLPDIAAPANESPDLDEIHPVLAEVIRKALKEFLAMRAREGQAMAVDMRKSLKTLKGLIREVEKGTANAVKFYAEKLAARIEELTASKLRDSLRLEEEIAIFAERTNINEECIRFRSHIDQFTATLKEDDAIGRRLNFLLQEMNREANTIGSKCSDFDISSTSIALKEEIEKIREQVQNVE
jgi:uncharacterized protein (TIGR00255 family)